jgi:hypothetical protein
MAVHKTQERNLLDFRFCDTKTKRFVNRLVYYENETIYDALRRRVQLWEEPGFVLVQSLEMPVGSGKSNAAIHSAISLDPDFNVDNTENLCFTAREFIDAVKQIKEGQAVIWDESALDFGGSRQWHDKINQTINQTMRLVRFKKGYLFLVLPLSTMIDKRVRLLCNIELEMLGVHHDRNLSYGIFRTVALKIDKYGRYAIIERLPIRFHSLHTYGFVGEYTFPKVSDKLWSQYLHRK